MLLNLRACFSPSRVFAYRHKERLSSPFSATLQPTRGCRHSLAKYLCAHCLYVCAIQKRVLAATDHYSLSVAMHGTWPNLGDDSTSGTKPTAWYGNYTKPTWPGRAGHQVVLEVPAAINAFSPRVYVIGGHNSGGILGDTWCALGLAANHDTLILFCPFRLVYSALPFCPARALHDTPLRRKVDWRRRVSGQNKG